MTHGRNAFNHRGDSKLHQRGKPLANFLVQTQLVVQVLQIICLVRLLVQQIHAPESERKERKAKEVLTVLPK
jgi:hypothetical protein